MSLRRLAKRNNSWGKLLAIVILRCPMRHRTWEKCKSVVRIQENLAFEADVENTWFHVSPLMVSLRHSRLLALWFGQSRSNRWFRNSRERMMTRSTGSRNPLIRCLSRSLVTRNLLSFMGPIGEGGPWASVESGPFSGSPTLFQSFNRSFSRLQVHRLSSTW